MKMCHKMKVYGRYQNGKLMPEIRLLGAWIKRAGYEKGQTICVTISEKGIMIEPYFTPDDAALNEIDKYFEKQKKEALKELPDIGAWIRSNGGISATSAAADVYELTQKQSGFRGKSALVRKNGLPLDILRDHAEWDGIIPPSMSTDEFGDLIKQNVLRR